MTRTRIGSDTARAWVRSLHLGNPYAKAILMAVANYVNDDGTAYPGIATLHADTEIAENTIIARLRWCDEIGAVVLSKCWVDENGRRNKEGRGRPTSNEIRFLVDADVEVINEAAKQHTADRPLRGAAKQSARVNPPNDDPPSESSPPAGEEQSSVSPSLAPQQPLTGATRIYEEEKESKIPSPTPSKMEGALKNQPQLSEAAEQRFREFKAAYPDGIVDLDKAQREFLGLADTDQAACVTAAPVYAARCRKRREKSKKAHLFIRERAWGGLLASTEAKPDAPTQHPPNSPAGRALLTLGRVIGYRPFQLANGNIVFHGEITAQLLALASAPPEAEWRPYKLGSGNFASWRDLGYGAFAGCALKTLVELYAPWPWPPRKDGSLITPGTDPPGTLSEQDIQALSGT